MPSSRPQHQPARRRSASANAVATARGEDEATLPREVAAERQVARIAARQHGIVTTEQLEKAGLSGTQLTRRVDGGWLVRRHVGVYRLGVFGGPFEEEMAALLACGPRSALSRWTSIAVFGLGPRPSHVDVVLKGNAGGRRAGVRPHRTTVLPAGDVVRRFRELVDFLDEPLFTRSEAERRLGSLCRSAGLPLPRMNVRRAGWEVDAGWDAQRLVVEVDGRTFHTPASKFERDRRKDGELMLAGYRVLRITWRRLTREPDQVIALIAGALALAENEGSRRR